MHSSESPVNTALQKDVAGAAAAVVGRYWLLLSFGLSP